MNNVHTRPEEAPLNRRDSHSTAWNAFTYVSFAAAVIMAALGICCLELDIWERGYMAIAALFLVHASISLTKTLRDRHEAAIAAERPR